MDSGYTRRIFSRCLNFLSHHLGAEKTGKHHKIIYIMRALLFRQIISNSNRHLPPRYFRQPEKDEKTNRPA